MSPDIARAIEMLRLAAEYIRQGDDYERLVSYDGAACDGMCVADDCEFAAAALAEQNGTTTATCKPPPENEN